MRTTASQTDTTGGVNLLLGFSVPSNKLLVIETISIQATVPVGQTVTADMDPSGTGFFFFPLQEHVTSSADFRGIFPVQIYARGSFQLNVRRDLQAGVFRIFGAIAGYLVDCEAGLADCPLP